MHDEFKVILAYHKMALVIVIGILIMTACAGQQAGPTPTPAASEVEVIEKEFSIEPEVSTINAGKVTFVVKNEGALEHNFVIEGLDQKVELILPLESETLEVNLSAGTYKLVCNLPGHEEAGMVAEITVE